MKSKGNRTKFEFVGSSSYPSASYSDSTVLTIYARAAITSPEVKRRRRSSSISPQRSVNYRRSDSSICTAFQLLLTVQQGLKEDQTGILSTF